MGVLRELAEAILREVPLSPGLPYCNIHGFLMHRVVINWLEIGVVWWSVE
jgi:hypothetical protein